METLTSGDSSGLQTSSHVEPVLRQRKKHLTEWASGGNDNINSNINKPFEVIPTENQEIEGVSIAIPSSSLIQTTVFAHHAKRQSALETIESTISEIQGIFHHLAGLVSEQQEILDRFLVLFF